MAGITQEEIGPLEAISEDKYRRNYFLRRSVATLREFAETYRLLSKCSDLQLLTKSFNQVAARRWERALSFFLKHESFFKLVRNDIGGHFGLNAAVYSLSTLGPTITGKIEYARYRDKGQGVKLHFASEIAARAHLKHLKGTTEERKLSYLLRRIVVGYRHAIWTADVVVFYYLWPRFGK